MEWNGMGLDDGTTGIRLWDCTLASSEMEDGWGVKWYGNMHGPWCTSHDELGWIGLSFGEEIGRYYSDLLPWFITNL
jgi:hypothetical protein